MTDLLRTESELLKIAAELERIAIELAPIQTPEQAVGPLTVEDAWRGYVRGLAAGEVLRMATRIRQSFGGHA